MRLSKELIKHIADAIAANLEAKGLAEYEVSKDVIASLIADVIFANMQDEDKLSKDVEKLLAAHEAEIARENMDYRKVFELTKQKLSKDRGFVL